MFHWKNIYIYNRNKCVYGLFDFENNNRYFFYEKK